MYHRQHLQSAIAICEAYNGDRPFAVFIKQFFKTRKQFGSRDRKAITHLCYCGFRTGKALTRASTEERIVTGLFLCCSAPDAMLETLRAGWNAQAALPLAEKLELTGLSPEAVFPFGHALSGDLPLQAWAASFFVQPLLFLRLRPGKEASVLKKLAAAGIDAEQPGDSCLALPPHSKADTLLQPDVEVVVQDYSSQQTGQLMQQAFKLLALPRPSVWDCCAGSGGKSILLYDLCPALELTVSDVRASILENLKERFAAAGIRHYFSRRADLSVAPLPLMDSDLIVADVPCSGSGTWSRTPEQLFYFDETEILRYQQLQRNILTHTVPSLRQGGFLLYITCSVFVQENEENLSWLQQEFGLRLITQQLFNGTAQKADTLFAALLQRP